MLYRQGIKWICCIAGGFLSGSLMFSSILPEYFLGVDVEQLSEDRNPGATNVFLCCGPVWGMLCLSLDFLKGFLPVLIGCRVLDTESLWFAAVIAAPVLGHAAAPLHHGRGGKCIAAAFGALFGLFPVSHIALLLCGVYIIFSTVVKITPNRLRSIAAFGLFGILSAAGLLEQHQNAAALGCALISLTAIWRHTRHFAVEAGQTQIS